MCWLQQSAQLWHYPTFLLLPLMVIAGIECFAGYRAWRLLLGLNGAVLGFIAGVWLSVMLGQPMLALIGSFVGAGAGVALFTGVTPIGSFVFMFGSAASLAVLLGQFAGVPRHWLMPGGGIVGAVSVLAALAIRRPVMIGLAAIAGAQQMASAWHAYSLPYDSMPLPDVVDPSELAIFVALATAGLVVQFATSRRLSADEVGLDS